MRSRKSIYPEGLQYGIMVEQIKYEVLREINKVEIRRYQVMVIARVDGYGDGGFNLLFSFITGNTGKSQKLR
jgi:hypothetical protein